MMLNNRVYDALKQIAQVYLPAAGTLYFALAQIWNLPSAEEVTGTIVAVDTFLGVVLGLSSSAYNKSDAKFDGSFAVEDTEDGSALRLKNVDYNALMSKNELTFKIDNSGTKTS